ncbi:MAG: ABC-2 family transporter protein [Cryobacterium sp.]|nr:ABC-2 family transporter protein [Oligoflexia bacterium]
MSSASASPRGVRKFFHYEWRLAALKNGFQDATAYRIEFLLEVLGAALIPAAIQWVLWYALFKIGGQTTVGGLTYEQMLAYTFTSILFTQVRGGDHDFELMEMVRSGGLSNYLLRPASVVEFVYIRGLAPKLFLAGLSLLIGVLVSFFVDSISAGRMVAAVFLAVLGNIIHYQIGAVIATLSFYWEEAYAVLMVKNMVVQILSGELIPLNLFPASMEWIWKSTPFYLYVYGPTQYALGRWSHVEFMNAVGVAMIWILGLSILTHWSWRLSIKRYLSLGG